MAVKRGAKGQASPAAKPKAARKAKAKPSPAIIAAADRAERRASLATKKPKERQRGTTAKRPPAKKAAPAAAAKHKPRERPPAAAAKAEKPKAAAAPKGPGRPTVYRREMCDQVRAYGSEGMGAAEISTALGVSRQTWENWKEAHPEFLDAVNEARWLAQAWYERIGRRGITMGKEFNALAWKLQVFNRFEHDYRDRREIKHDAGDGLLGLLSELDGTTGRFRKAA